MSGPSTSPTIKRDFPILEREVNGKRLVYLDSASSSQKPLAVLDAMDDCYRRYYANIHRGVYSIAEESTAAFEAARGARSRTSSARRQPRRSCSSRNATEAINLVAYTWARANLQAGDAIVLSHMEHHANVVPWHMLAAERGVELRWIPLTADYRLDLTRPRRAARRREAPRDQRDVERARNDQRHPAARRRRARRATRWCSSTRASTCRTSPTDVQAWDADFVAFSAHKMLGPSGIGALWARRELLDAMPPFLGGGEMIRDVRLDGFTTERAAVEVRGRHPGDRRGGRVRRGRRLPRRRSAWTRYATTRCDSRATRSTRSATVSPTRCTIYGPHRHLDPRRRGVVPVRRDPRPRHQPGPRRGRRVRARRAPLRQAADAPARRTGDDAGRRSTSTTTRPTSTCSSKRSPRPRSSSHSDGNVGSARDGRTRRPLPGDHPRPLPLAAEPRRAAVPPAHKVEGFNPLCGDEVVLYFERRTRHRHRPRHQDRRARAARSARPRPR